MAKGLKLTAAVKLELRELLMSGVSAGNWVSERTSDAENSPCVVSNADTKLCSVRSAQDAEFIVLARNHMLSLLDELDAAQKDTNVKKEVAAQKRQATKRAQGKQLRPECYGTFRSPQSDAESCCEDCQHNTACFDAWFSGKL